MKNLLFPCHFLIAEFDNDFNNDLSLVKGSTVWANLYLIASHVVVMDDDAPAYMQNIGHKKAGEIIRYVGGIYDASESSQIKGYIERHPTLNKILSISNLINQITL